MLKSEEALDKASNLISKRLEKNIIIGLGSGSSVARFLKNLKEYKLKVVCSSWQIQILAEELGLEILSLPPKRIDIHIDGADQISENFDMIKGYGGALFKEKVLMSLAKERIILADEAKFVKKLNKPIPIEFLPFSKNFVYQKLLDLGGKPNLRVLDKGYPFITDNGNMIFDTDFGEIEDPRDLEIKLKKITGILEVGIFTLKPTEVYKLKDKGDLEIFKI